MGILWVGCCEGRRGITASCWVFEDPRGSDAEIERSVVLNRGSFFSQFGWASEGLRRKKVLSWKKRCVLRNDCCEPASGYANQVSGGPMFILITMGGGGLALRLERGGGD